LRWESIARHTYCALGLVVVSVSIAVGGEREACSGDLYEVVVAGLAIAKDIVGEAVGSEEDADIVGENSGWSAGKADKGGGIHHCAVVGQLHALIAVVVQLISTEASSTEVVVVSAETGDFLHAVEGDWIDGIAFKAKRAGLGGEVVEEA
jgi:hypothetical protein